MIHGNRARRGRGIKLLHWNKGSSFLYNKHNEIENIIGGHTPHVLGLSEANFKSTHDLNSVQHQNYSLHTCTTLDNPALGISRVVVYTHQSLVVELRHDLEDNTISAIWLELGLPYLTRRRLLFVMHTGNGSILVSRAVGQVLLLLSFNAGVFFWTCGKSMQEGKEVLVMMDANLDFLKWTKDDLPANDTTRRLLPLIEVLFASIFPQGVSQLVTSATCSWPGQADSGLDHIYSNKPDKLSNVYTEYSGGSDHKLIKVTRFAKSMSRNARYVRKRSFKNFDAKDCCLAVKNIYWFDLFMCDDVHKATDLLTSKLNIILDSITPVRTFQVRQKYAPWLIDRTKAFIKNINEAQKLASQTKDQDDWRHLRNAVTARMKEEKKLWEMKKLDNSQNYPSTI